MTDETPERDTILRNFHLVASSWNFFVFAVSPAISWALLGYLCTHLNKDSLLPLRLQFFVGLACPILALALAAYTSEKIKASLEDAGYTQRRQRDREIELFVTFAVCAACLHYAHNWSDDDLQSMAGLRGYLLFLLSGLALWSTMLLLLLGPTLWFTVRAS